MTFERWRTVAEAMGLVAVAASLVFVGIQIKQTQEIARASMRLELTTASQEVIFALVEYPELHEVVTGVREPQNPEEVARAYWLARAALRGYENYVYQYENGFLDEGQWEGQRHEIRRAMSLPFNRRVWEESRAGFSPQFRQTLDGLIGQPE